MLYPLETDRMELVEVTLDHIPHFFRLHSYPQVDEFNTMGIPASTDITLGVLQSAIDDQQNAERSKIIWAVFLKSDGSFIGELGLSYSGAKYRRGHIHYLLDPNYWGNGYATELVRALLEFGFKKFNMHRIEAGVATENKASIRVLEKAGMQLEGRHRKILPIRGQWVDNYHYAIVETDPRL